MSQRRTPPRTPKFNRLSEDKLTAMIEEATVDCCDESEQLTGWFTIIEENLEAPFETRVLGVQVTVERIDQDRDDRIVAICRCGGETQAVPIPNVPLPSPLPRGSEWIEAFRRWLEHG
jgi:hypothetical protein